MLTFTKKIAREYLPKPFFGVLKHWHRCYQINSNGPYSEEESTTLRWLADRKISDGHFVDIAAQDGIGGSQTLQLAKAGWSGLAVECDPDYFASLSHFYARFPRIDLVRNFISPANINSLLRGCGCPREFAFLSLDIDSFDYEILDSILAEYRPKLICCEINEVIPPPLEFRVKFAKDLKWEGGCFQGQSISMCDKLIRKYRYSIVELCYNNLYLVPSEDFTGKAWSAAEAYKTGYLDRPDRLDRFPWNRRFESIHGMSDADKLTFFEREFRLFKGRFELQIANNSSNPGADAGFSPT